MTNVLDICDEIAGYLEASSGNRDDSRAMPIVYTAGLLYLWPRSEAMVPAGDGSLDDEQFRLRVAWVTDATDEQAAELRTRATTNTIHTKAAAYAAVVRAHRRGSTYEALRIDSFDFEGLTTLESRGFWADLSGYLVHA
jgi:hypothetical protein